MVNYHQMIFTMIRKILRKLLPVLVILGIWFICSSLINQELILPSPVKVFSNLFYIIQKKEFWKAFSFTFLRVLASFVITVVLGVLLGFVTATSKLCKDFFDFPIAVMRSTPVIAVILVAIFWFKSDFVPVFVAVLMALPVMITSVQKGFSCQNEKLMFMANTYNFSRKQIFIYIKMPAVKPYFYNGCQSTFGLCWKVVTAGEVLSLPKSGFGTIISRAQVHLETADVMAITIVLVLVSYGIEKLCRVVFSYEK